MLARGADVHRHHRPQALVRERLTAPLKQVPEAAGGNGEHHVVDGPPQRVLDLLEIPQRHAQGSEPPVRADWLVEARVGGRVVEPERLVFSVSDQPGDDAYELVIVVLTDLGDGRTEMLFQQRGHMTPAQYERAGQGWSGFFDRMAEHLADA
jgi:Activator of Hsp90 ATPase homolog 1-like protein.